MTAPKDEDEEDELATAASPLPLLDASLSETPKLNFNLYNNYCYSKMWHWRYTYFSQNFNIKLLLKHKHYIPSSNSWWHNYCTLRNLRLSYCTKEECIEVCCSNTRLFYWTKSKIRLLFIYTWFTFDNNFDLCPRLIVIIDKENR